MSRRRAREALRQDHHTTPGSRGGLRTWENILRAFPWKLHQAWHRLFGNLLPLEIFTVLLKNLLRGGQYRGYQRVVNDRTGPAPQWSPDVIVLCLIEKFFPKDWVPGKELIEELEKRRRKKAP